MPPRLAFIQAYIHWKPQKSPLSQFLAPIFIQPTQCRSASILTTLSDTKGAYNKRIRRGRGPASGKGKTSGRGHKGQKQHGKVPRGFNGGQTPLEVVHGKRGFDNQFSIEMSPLNIDRVQAWINQGRLDPSKPITMKELNDSRCLHGVKDGIKLLARGSEKLTTPINIIVSRASAAAIAAIESAGGKVTTRYYAPQSIRRILHGQSDPLSFLGKRKAQSGSAESATSLPAVETAKSYAFKLSNPTGRKDIEYYRDPAHRGYMRHKVKRGQGPSLFFKTPGSSQRQKPVNVATSESSNTAISRAENRIW